MKKYLKNFCIAAVAGGLFFTVTISHAEHSGNWQTHYSHSGDHHKKQYIKNTTDGSVHYYVTYDYIDYKNGDYESTDSTTACAAYTDTEKNVELPKGGVGANSKTKFNINNTVEASGSVYMNICTSCGTKKFLGQSTLSYKNYSSGQPQWTEANVSCKGSESDDCSAWFDDSGSSNRLNGYSYDPTDIPDSC